MRLLDGDKTAAATRPCVEMNLQRASVLLYASLAVVVVALAIDLAPLWTGLHRQWTTVSYYQHGYIVAAMAFWLAWRSLRYKPEYSIACDYRYSIPLLVVLVLMSVMELLYLNVPRLFLIPPLIVACVGFVFGHAVGKRIFWPAVLIYSALPIWPVINSSLQSLTTRVVSVVLDATGVVAFIEGNFVHLPAGSFQIAEECSGLKYFIVSVTLAMFYGLAFLRAWTNRMLLIAVALALAVVCNWVRVYTVILAGHLTDMQHYLVAENHITFGWILFGAFMLPVFWIAQRLESRRGSRPVVHSSPPVGRPGNILALALIASLLLALPRFATLAVAGIAPAQVAAIGGTLSSQEAPPWQPVFTNAIEEYSAFDSGDGVVDLYRASFPLQDVDHRLVRFENSFVPVDWQPLSERSLSVELGQSNVTVIEAEGYLNRSRRLVWGWYRVAGRLAAHPVQAKGLEFLGLLSGRRDAEAFVLSVGCAIDCIDARNMLQEFLRNPPGVLTMEGSEEQE
jgi:EpsI family protein